MPNEAKPKGYNPLRYDCQKLSGDEHYSACFNKKKRPKIEQFAECFPGNINFSDVDGVVEISGNALFLEWKPDAVELPSGQRIMWSRLTIGRRLTVFCAAGDAETMTIYYRAAFINGKWRDWRPSNLGEFKNIISRWAVWARAHPRIGR